jgi:hypothetical protein
MISYKRIVLRECAAEDRVFMDLYEIFRATLKPDMRFREFRAYYYSERLEYIDVTFVLMGGLVIGFCAAAFYRSAVSGRRGTIGRAATGILAEYRGKAMPKWRLYTKYMRYWFRYPFRDLILTAYVANPLIYAMICKYTGILYPRRAVPVPEDILLVRDELMGSRGSRRPGDEGFVMPIHFSVSLGEQDCERIYTSKDGSVRYYLRINPRFRQQHGVLVIIPVNALNILWSSLRFLVRVKA